MLNKTTNTFNQLEKLHFDTKHYALIDSGGTCGFQSNEENIIPGTISKLKPPVSIKMGTCTTKAHKMGIRLFCQPSTKEEQTIHCFAHLMLIVEDFDKKLIIISVPRLKLQQMQVHDPSLNFSPYLYSDLTNAEFVPQDHKNLHKDSNYMLIARAKSGLMYLPHWNYEDKLRDRYVDMTTGSSLDIAGAISKISSITPQHLATRLKSNFTSHSLINQLSGVGASLSHLDSILESLFYVNMPTRESEGLESLYNLFVKEAASKCMNNRNLGILMGKILEEMDSQQFHLADISEDIRVSKRKTARIPSRSN
jgi:hypothetical protein